MKHIYLLMIVIGMLSASCMSSKKAIEQGRYNQAYRIALQKLKKNSDKDKLILAFEEAFNLIQQQDFDRINRLKNQHDPALWDEIFDTYNAINRRQDAVNLLPDLNIKKQGYRSVELKIVNTDNETEVARSEAAEYAYSKGKQLLDRGGRSNARLAFASLDKTSKYFYDYKDVAELKLQALNGGISEIFIETNPGYAVLAYPSIASDLKSLDLVKLNNQWQQFYTRYDSTLSYEYTIRISIKEINYGPEHISENHYMEFKEIQDGWNYVLDSKGNVLKDSLGNDIKTPRIVKIQCAVVETAQFKKVAMTGDLVLINNNTGQSVHTEHIAAESLFQNFSAIAIGDLNALSEETLNKIRTHYVPFPTDYTMLRDAGSVFNEISHELIRKNSKYLM